jgi:hypothetical protein
MAPTSNPRQREPLFDVHPRTGISFEVFYSDRTLETFGRCGSGWFWWSRRHLQAEHMVCTDQSAYVKKALASPEPSTHGTKLTCHPVQRMSADVGYRTTTPPGTKAKTGRSSDSLTREKRYDFQICSNGPTNHRPDDGCGVGTNDNHEQS